MPNPVAAPDEADALRRMAKAMTRVHVPAPLLQFLLALLATLFRSKPVMAGLPMGTEAGRTWRTPLRDWQFSPTGETIEDLAPVLSPGALRRLRRQRARIGWLVRGLPGLGMRRRGRPAPAPCPAQAARAPPHAAPFSMNPSGKPRLARR